MSLKFYNFCARLLRIKTNITIVAHHPDGREVKFVARLPLY